MNDQHDYPTTPGNRRGRNIGVGVAGGSAAALFLAAMFGVFDRDNSSGAVIDVPARVESTAAARPVSTPAPEPAHEPNGASDLNGGTDQDATRPTPPADATPADDPAAVVVAATDTPPPVLRRLCVEVRHQPVPGQESLSGIWVFGDVDGNGPHAHLTVGGPTMNGGTPVDITIDPDGSFEGGLGINQVGEHAITQVDIVDADGPIDVLPQLDGYWGVDATVLVGPDEGAVFEPDCFDDSPGPGDLAASAPSSRAFPGDPMVAADDLLANFIEAQLANDVDGLVAALHPAVPLAYGDDVCREYLERTAGSIIDYRLDEVGRPEPFEIVGPNGPVGFPTTLPTTVTFTIQDGTVETQSIHLPFDGDDVYWLTTCGFEAP